jgi:translation initiation factor 3 subunit C
VRNRFQAFAFKCNLHRYFAGEEKKEEEKKKDKKKDKTDAADDGFAVVGKKGQAEKKELDVMKCPKEQVTYAMVENKLKDIISSRGKKGTDRHENVEHLAYIATVSKCPAQEVEVLIMLISAQFDISGRVGDTFHSRYYVVNIFS